MIKGVAYDIETTGLSALAGDVVMTCAFAPFDGSEPYVFKNPMVPVDQDIDLIQEIAKELEKYDLIVGWNSHGFDLPFLNTRLMQQGQHPILHTQSMDLMKELKIMFPYFGSQTGAKLDDFAKALDLEYQKTAFSPPIWARAISGDEEAMDFIVEHNLLDVHVTRLVFAHYYDVNEDEQ